jgi:hypothetical protein
LLGEVLGVGGYDDCVAHADEAEIFGNRHRVLSLEKLIAAKRAAARPKDLLALVELEAILEHRRASERTAP